MFRHLLIALFITCLTNATLDAKPLVYEGEAGSGKGKHLVFLAGDHEYRSEETLPALARILAKRHGFKCTVLFTVDPKSGEIVPGCNNVPGIEALKTADLMVIFFRFQDLPDEQMRHVVDYLDRAGPVVGLRTSTHAFKMPADAKHVRFSFRHAGKDFQGGFGRQILGETWAGHYGKNHTTSTRLDLVPTAKAHPVLRGVKDAWVLSGAYFTDPMPDSEVLALARVLKGTKPDSRLDAEKKAVPGAWTRTYKNAAGKSARVFNTTCGASVDLLNDGFRRMLVNACFWAVGMEEAIKPDLATDFVGPYNPVTFRFNGYRLHVKPSELAGWTSPILPKDKPLASDKKKKPQKNNKEKKAKPKQAVSAEVDYEKYAIYEKTAPIAKSTTPVVTKLPLSLNKGDRIALIGNTLFDRAQHFGYFETMLHQAYPWHDLIVRNLAWSGDTPDLQPRPANFASTIQHLTHEKIDVVFAAYGYNESFAGKAGLAKFKSSLSDHVAELKSRAFNGTSGPRIVLLSPIANENVKGVDAATRNNAQIQLYAKAIKQVADERKVGYADVFTATKKAMSDKTTDLTFNGAHLVDKGYRLFARTLFEAVFDGEPTAVNERLRREILDKNRQYFRRFRPANTYYYTGARNKSYGYLDFLPAMRNFDVMVANREKRIWALAQGKAVPARVDDSNVPPLPKTIESRGANQWMSAKEERKAFKVDPRFDVTLFAGEEQFPDIAAPIQMRWDNKGRLWVSCSKTYPHVYPGNEPEDKIVILEDTDGDGKADKSTVFADKLHVPLSFVLGDGGVYVSEMPHLTFLKDTDGDGKADVRRRLLTGFGTEDSHHSLHDFTWTPDGDLLFRESIFHHSQVETPYGPVRQQNSGWFRYEPRTHRLTSFGTYRSTNPWGVTFDDWGRHVASHPIFAAAFHSLDPEYPTQHPSPRSFGIQAYSGVAGHEFVDTKAFPDELQGFMIKVRYKPTNRVEILKWKEGPYGFDEEYVGDLLFSSNLSFIPVDLQFGPRGALYVCDWYNPVKGHAQYSLRDERRDRHSGRIWRITAKGKKLQEPSKIADATIPELLDLLKRPEYRRRYWAKRELRDRDPVDVKKALDAWVKKLDPKDVRHRHHQIEAIWTYRLIDAVNSDLLRELLQCRNHHARAAATQQLRYWHPHLKDATESLSKSGRDVNALVRLEAVIAATYVGTPAALDVVLEAMKLPHDKHLSYAILSSLGSHTLARHWKNDAASKVPQWIARAEAKMNRKPREPRARGKDKRFDQQENLKTVRIDCVPERMTFTIKQFPVVAGQPVKLVFVNEDATDHNLVIVQPGSLEEVGMAANAMAKDPRNANSDFIPEAKKHLILQHSPMIGPMRKSLVHVMRFHAPTKPGVYPYVCTFPGHWVIMTGEMVVGKSLSEAEAMIAERKPKVVKQWTLADFGELNLRKDERSIMRGMRALTKARCLQCHQVDGHGVNLGPSLAESKKKYKGAKLLQQLLEPSSEIHEKYRAYQFYLKNGKTYAGLIVKETPTEIHVAANLLAPNNLTIIKKRDVEEKVASKVSSMPEGLLYVLTKEEVLDLLAYLESDGYQLPMHLKHKHAHPKK